MEKKHQCRKRFGQNFLQDSLVIEQIVAKINPQANDHIIEIGPGLGALTQALLPKVAKLDVIELDRDLIPKLAAKFGKYSNLTIHQGDILKFDLAALINEQSKARIIGNLPYNISTPLLFYLLAFADKVTDLHFMLQDEVAKRLAAAAGNKSYGRLSVMIQYHLQVEYLFKVAPDAFAPAPKVNSAFVRLTPWASKEFTTCPKLLQAITTLAFNQRRKTILNSLKTKLSKADFVQLNIAPELRPEQLKIADYIAICNYLIKKTAS